MQCPKALGMLVVFILLGTGCPAYAAQVVNAPIYPFALCSNGSYLTNPDYPPKLLDTGARMVRLDLRFPDVRKQPGDDPAAWNWTDYDRVRTLLMQYPKLQVLPILGYGTVKIPATKGKTAVLIDRHNARTSIKAKDGAYTLTLAGATNVGGWPTVDNSFAKALGTPEHLIGGATQIVVEQ